MQTFAGNQNEVDLLGVGVFSNLIAIARFDAAQDADQPFADATPVHDAIDEGFLIHVRRLKVDVGASLGFGQTASVVDDSAGDVFTERSKIAVKDAVSAQEPVHALAITN